MSELFENLTRTEYVITESGIKVPYSDFDRQDDYYEVLRNKTYTGDEYANLAKFKDKGIALYDKRWKSAKAVIDLIAEEIDIDPEKCGLNLYVLDQRNGKFESVLIVKMRQWFDKSGDKVKLKKRISELEAQINLLQTLLKT